MLLSELAQEMIPYTPKEPLFIAHKEYNRCLLEKRVLSNDLGFGNDWKRALDHVKTQSRNPPFFLGGQPILVASPASSMAQPLKAAFLRVGWDAGGDDQGIAGGGVVSGALDEMEVLRLRKARSTKPQI
ncbi:unnamed protein product, partial [Clonostachys rhizophaga]